MARSQRGLIYSKYDYFCCIFLTAGWFATKLGLVVQHYKLECPFEKWDYCVKVKVTAKVQNVSECLSRWYFLNYRTFCYQIWYGEVASWARVSCGNFVVVVVAVFKVKVTAFCFQTWYCNVSLRYDSFYCIFWTVDPFATKPGLVVHYHKPEFLMEKWDCLFRVKVTTKFQNVNACLSRWFVLNRWTFYYQIWYGDASLCARLSFKKTGLLSSRSRSQLRVI